MGNQFKQRTYQCKCGCLTKEYVWDNELVKTKVKCGDCKKTLTNKDLVKPNTNQVIGIRTPTKNR